VDFELVKKEPPQVYLFGDILMQVSVAITKSDGKTLPDPKRLVALANNSMHSLFHQVIMSINSQDVM